MWRRGSEWLRLASALHQAEKEAKLHHEQKVQHDHQHLSDKRQMMRQHAFPPQAPPVPVCVRAPQARGSPCFKSRPLLPPPQSWLAPGSLALHGKQSVSDERVSSKMTDGLDASLPAYHLTTHCLPMTGALTAARDTNVGHGMEAEGEDLEKSMERAADILVMGNVVSDIAGASDIASARSTPEPPLKCNAAPGSTRTGVAQSPRSHPLPAPEKKKEPIVTRARRGRALKHFESAMKSIQLEKHSMTSPPHTPHRLCLGSLSERLVRPGLCPSPPGPGPCLFILCAHVLHASSSPLEW